MAFQRNLAAGIWPLLPRTVPAAGSLKLAWMALDQGECLR